MYSILPGMYESMFGDLTRNYKNDKSCMTEDRDVD